MPAIEAQQGVGANLDIADDRAINRLASDRDLAEQVRTDKESTEATGIPPEDIAGKIPDEREDEQSDPDQPVESPCGAIPSGKHDAREVQGYGLFPEWQKAQKSPKAWAVCHAPFELTGSAF